MSKEADFFVTEVTHYLNQIELAISKLTKDFYIPYDEKSELCRRLNDLANRLDDDYVETK